MLRPLVSISVGLAIILLSSPSFAQDKTGQPANSNPPAVTKPETAQQLDKRGKTAQTARITLTESEKAKLQKQGQAAQANRIKLSSSDKIQLQKHGQAAQANRIKLSSAEKNLAQKQGQAAQGARTKLSSTEKMQLQKQGQAAQASRGKGTLNVNKDVIKRGELAQKSRLATKQPTPAPKGILKNSANKTAAGAGAKKSVTFNRQVQTKQIPSGSGKKLISQKSQSLKKPVTATKTPSLAKGKSAAKAGGAKLGKFGKAAGVVGGAVVVTNSGTAFADAQKQLKSGKLSKSDYNKLQATNAVKLGGEVAKLKKLNPTALLLNDVVGTDPISLGVDAVGDLINGTDNAEQSLRNMKSAWNSSLTKQAFTDPEEAARRVGNDLKEAGQDVAKFGKKVGNDVAKAGQKVEQGIDKAKQAVASEVKKAGNAAKDAGKKVGGFVKGLFGKKK